MANRLVTELFLERPSFKEVSQVVKSLKSVGVDTLLMPPEDRGINTHLVIDNKDVEKARGKLKELGVSALEKEVVLIELENRPGAMALAASRIASKGVNLTYAFCVAMNSKTSYVLFGGDDNAGILKALQ
ncbi:hypothetical protein H0O00_04030 [Candidatus Micrarchaeota archaeon]|nr:hypothetical protein [Candidatus Micrarchaeota archaeon]